MKLIRFVLLPSLILLGVGLSIGCKANLVLVQDKSLPIEKQAKIVVGRHLSIRAIDRVVGGEAKRIFSGYLGESDRVVVDPGEYLLTTKLEFSESFELSPNRVASIEFRPANADSLLVALDPGGEYEISNKAFDGNKWAPQAQKLTNSGVKK